MNVRTLIESPRLFVRFRETADSKFREAVRLSTSPGQVVNYIESLKASMWPGGQLRPKDVAPRAPADKAATKQSANRKLLALMPGEPRVRVI